MDSTLVEEKIREAIGDEGAFLVDYSIGSDNRILVTADHPEGITLERLTRISRKIEGQFDREEEDFAIDVSSPGVGTPLKVKEQYQLSVGRLVKVVMQDGREVSGEATAFEEDRLTVKWQERVPKEVGKGKRTITREEILPLDEIRETRLEIRF